MLIGAKLSFSKMFVGQVTVAGLDKADGFDFWRKIFAASWIRNDHLWEDTRQALDALVIVAGVLVVVGVIELSYQRAPAREASGPRSRCSSGSSAAWSGSSGSLNTDGVGANTVFGIVMGAGILVGVIGWGRWRYDPLRRKGAFQVDGKAGRSR